MTQSTKLVEVPIEQDILEWTVARLGVIASRLSSDLGYDVTAYTRGGAHRAQVVFHCDRDPLVYVQLEADEDRKYMSAVDFGGRYNRCEAPREHIPDLARRCNLRSEMLMKVYDILAQYRVERRRVDELLARVRLNSPTNEYTGCLSLLGLGRVEMKDGKPVRVFIRPSLPTED